MVEPLLGTAGHMVSAGSVSPELDGYLAVTTIA
jgi:hypothetical protein